MSLLRNLERRIAELVARAPRDYECHDQNGAPTIQSELSPPKWFTGALGLLRSAGRKQEKADLRAALGRTTGSRDGDRLWELVAAVAEEPPAKPVSVTSALPGIGRSG
ncbi:MAG: hypothetical protein ACREMY_00205 [bacterium]